eukprot:TRINITY_DN3479_c0_g1_i2.p1 TRINITY_DN3479_c0_g1~~TRINITY_DN3479_c0_g1_i2.p1  ORF type:complete len:196 (-),score=9.08 TRINITY_DN3479_c0_g1_i2:227-814(-)
METRIVVKFMVMGDTCVGKTSFLEQFSSGTFKEKFESTIGFEFCRKEMVIGKALVVVYIYDVTGNEKFYPSHFGYISSVHGVILMYDVSSYESFAHVSHWRDEVLRKNESAVLMIVGNKADKTEQKQVDSVEALDFAENNEMEYCETSAKTGANVEETVVRMVGLCIKNNPEMKKYFLHSKASTSSNNDDKCILN